MRILLGAALVAAAAAVPPRPAVHAAAIASGTRFACTPTAVWDGDGPIWCAEGPKIRLAGVAAREIDGSCRPSHPCPGASGEAARGRLVSLLGGAAGTLPSGHVRVRGPRLACVSAGDGKGGRTAAWCAAPAVGDLSCAMVASGHALRWDRYWRGRDCGSGGRLQVSAR